MELIKVNSLKLKIILTPEDMKEFEISTDMLDYADSRTRRAFNAILEKARNQTGFCAKNDNIYVQLFPSRDGGCEMFLTRRGKLMPEPDENSGNTYLKKKYTLSYDTQSKERKYIAESDSIESIIRLCIRMKKSDFTGKSSLYALQDKYYLVIVFPKAFPSFMRTNDFMYDEHQRFAFMSEYALLNYANELPLAYIKEHGTLIIEEDAVSHFANSFG